MSQIAKSGLCHCKDFLKRISGCLKDSLTVSLAVPIPLSRDVQVSEIRAFSLSILSGGVRASQTGRNISGSWVLFRTGVACLGELLRCCLFRKTRNRVRADNSDLSRLSTAPHRKTFMAPISTRSSCRWGTIFSSTKIN
jgi:hypothetical protein